MIAEVDRCIKNIDLSNIDLPWEYCIVLHFLTIFKCSGITCDPQENRLLFRLLEANNIIDNKKICRYVHWYYTCADILNYKVKSTQKLLANCTRKPLSLYAEFLCVPGLR